jgi:hypothetical protein
MEDRIVIVNEILSQRYISNKDLKITSRQVSYWKDRNILPFFEKNSHSKMNIPMATWMHMVRVLSDLGISSSNLTDLAKQVWQTPRDNDYLKDKIDALLNSHGANKLEAQTKERLLYIRGDSRLMDTLGQELNPFTDCLVDSILIERNFANFYYFPKSGDFYLNVGHAKATIDLLSLMDVEPFICIPLMPFIETIVSIEFGLLTKDLKYLSEVENQIRDIVIYKAPKNILIVLNDKEIEILVIREEHKKAEQLAAFFMNNKLPKNAKLLIEPRAQGNYKITIITK